MIVFFPSDAENLKINLSIQNKYECFIALLCLVFSQDKVLQLSSSSGKNLDVCVCV